MDTRRARSDINITPLIDIVLVLLIVFIVLVPSLSQSLAVSVPRLTGTTSPVAPVVLTLDGAGRLFLQREEVPLGSLRDRLVPVVLKQPLGARKLFLKVDGDLPHERAVQVLDEIRVASDRACIETRARFRDEDGGAVKVAVALLRPGAAIL